MSETFQMAVVVVVLAATFFLFIKEWIPTELAALAGFATLLATGILDERDVGGIFGNAAPFTIGAMFILSEALTRTGVIEILATQFQALARGSELRALVFLAIIVMPASAFLNNTPVVVVFLPIVIATCRSTGLKATRLLIPLSFLSILGGTTTLIGTSTNLLVSGAGGEPRPARVLDLRDHPARNRLRRGRFALPVVHRPAPACHRSTRVSSTLDLKDTRRFYSAIEIDAAIPRWSASAWSTARSSRACRSSRSTRSSARATRLHSPLTDVTIEGDDIYWLRASSKNISQAQKLPGVRLLRRHLTDSPGEDPGGGKKSGRVRCGWSRRSSGQTVRSSARRCGRRPAPPLRHPGGRAPPPWPQPASRDSRTSRWPSATRSSSKGRRGHRAPPRGGRPPEPPGARPGSRPATARQAPIAILALFGVVFCSALGVLPITSAAIVGAVFVVLTRCLDTKSAFESIDWKILFLIYGMLGIGRGDGEDRSGQARRREYDRVLEPAGPTSSSLRSTCSPRSSPNW